ncbi:MAG: DUF3810 domain-containing protein [Clostridia bacterium]|nr:DUF3810 domain-containing protein [Clostridia bacterium]
MSKKITDKLKKLFSPFFIVSLCLIVFGFAVRITASHWTAFADLWQSRIASVPRALLAYLTNVFPFSIAESIILLSPLVIAVLIYTASKRSSDSWTATFRYSFNLLAAAGVLYSLLLINFSAGYYTTPLDKRIGADRQNVSAEELCDTAEMLIDGVRDSYGSVDFIYGEGSVMPYDLKTLNKKLNEAYKKAHEKYPFLSDFYSNPKPVALSEPWTYTHIAGVYTFFTGEANININFPDYTLPYTVAHEMAHQRGISREDEANFVAFLVCIESDDDYIRYSAYSNAFEYVASSLYSADSDMYKQLYRSKVPTELKNEMTAYNEFFEKYRENKVANVSEKVNDTFLKVHDQKEGTRSYGLVVDLLVAYYKNINK